MTGLIIWVIGWLMIFGAERSKNDDHWAIVLFGTFTMWPALLGKYLFEDKL